MTAPDILLHGTMWRICSDVFMNARLGPTSSSERKGPLTPNDLAKESFVPLRQYSAHPRWRQSADLETLRRYLSVLRRACARRYEFTKVGGYTCTVRKVSLGLVWNVPKHQAPAWTVFACHHCQDKQWGGTHSAHDNADFAYSSFY
jgi:hypothetical protein